MIIIGSVSAMVHGVFGDDYKPSDTDIIGSYEEMQRYIENNKVISVTPTSANSNLIILQDKSKVEWEISWEGSSGHLLQKVLNSLNGKVMAPPEVLYTLKMSHRFKKNSPHFRKTMDHIKALREYLCSDEIPEYLQEFYDLRVKETYDYNHPSLDVSKDAFFADDGIPYEYDHDSLHEAIRILGKPAYTYFKPDDKEVYCSKEMFYQQPYYIQLLSVVEEAMVLTLERSLIPNKFNPDADKMFRYALMKVCTSITSGWWRDFAWENYDEALGYYKSLGKNYLYNSFKQGKLSGKIKPFK
ncbi:hypothetical protein AXI76_gp151 [Pseudoalteromonas phage H101]|uniref:Uncharacterized protein n=1 Tax=Pseudoalteromonas phage H101 TaxID=1654919 RepID=A0A0H4INZ9_9CAUD|nr:hypothetical protein AXI76_gp151 [Pseudoalteromonas phage H101]AKO61052.1 hypothetical protein [Pseudoalteromonas phage H101]|tara:strand:- start:14011 stop:14907 length:897 start_codon:yes stop_codon:yes gene_type:complete